MKTRLTLNIMFMEIISTDDDITDKKVLFIPECILLNNSNPF